MIEFVKDKIARFVVNRKLKHIENKNLNFANVFAKSYNFLIILPEEEKDFHHSQQVLSFLEENRKNSTILTRDFRVSLLPSKFRFRVIEYNLRDINKLNLPGTKLTEKLSSLHVNVVIDLNRSYNLFCSYACSLVNAEVRVGFAKESSDKFYNLQIVNNDEPAELSYKNFLNCLQMF